MALAGAIAEISRRTFAQDFRANPHRERPHAAHRGQSAAPGVGRAICEVGKLHFGGFVAWLAWIAIHIYSLSSMGDRLCAFMNWA